MERKPLNRKRVALSLSASDYNRLKTRAPGFARWAILKAMDEDDQLKRRLGSAQSAQSAQSVGQPK